MSEMVGNRFFLAGRFAEGAEQFERVLETHPERTGVKMKLVICYAMGERLHDALKLAADILQNDPDAPAQLDDQVGVTCRDAIQQLRKQEASLSPSVFHASMGVLGLFCNQSRALEQLNQALRDDPLLGEVHRLCGLVERHLEAGHAS